MTEERVERVSSRLNASPRLREAIQKAVEDGRVPAALLGAIPDIGLESVKVGAAPLESVLQIDALEAIVQRFGRPPLVVRNDKVELEPLPDLPVGTDVLIKAVEPRVKSVGRVEFLNHSMAWGGTGWVIDGKGKDRVVATNRHVAKLVAQRVGDGRGVFLRSPTTGARYGMSVDFKEEVGSLPGDAIAFTVTGISYLADDTAPDVALLQITGKGLPSPLELAREEATAGELVALIGYPAFDSRNDAGDQARYFKDLYEVKRFAPGKILQALTGATLLTHDCTSLGGNSGSPLIRLDDGKVVGLHFSGTYGVANTAVGASTLRALLKGQRPVSVVLGEAAATEGAADGVHKAIDFAGRKGYDPKFLDDGVAAPWPKLSKDIKAGLAKPSDAVASRPFELRYTHFGVQFSGDLRQPVMTAVNIDGAHAVKIKRGTDRWFQDERVPLARQLRQADYDDLQIDRGHMVRREDPNWDADVVPGPNVVSALAEQADFDTFHYTNAAPQHSTLNQGKQLWQGLENYILESARTRGFKACVFTGPVIRADDPEIKPGVRAPREFWKLVAMEDADKKELHATAYLLSQGDLIRELLEKRARTEALEGFVLGQYRTFQIAVRDLANATGYDFSAYAKADPLAATGPGNEALASGEPVFIPLESLQNIVM